MSHRTGSERGAAATEVVLLAPIVMLVVAMLVGGARLWLARAAVTAAAQAGARAATLEYSAGAASLSGAAAAEAGLDGVPCATSAVAIDASGYAVAVGHPAAVTATVSCAVPLGDLFGLGLPGSITVEATNVSVLDSYRRRQ